MKDTRFFILITQRNAAPYIGKCLDSVLAQTYTNYRAIIMDDDSDDGTWEIIQKNYPMFESYHTAKQVYHIKNFIAGINLGCETDEDVIVFVSGDDYLYGNDVLEYLNAVYQDDVWLTYGNFIRTSGHHGKGCKQIRNTRSYRKGNEWLASHLVTCKKKLFDKIRPQDLLIDGHLPNNSFDCAMLYPMIEMAGLKHMRFIDKVLYVYNDENPVQLVNYKKDPRACIRERRYWQSKPSYAELTEL